MGYGILGSLVIGLFIVAWIITNLLVAVAAFLLTYIIVVLAGIGVHLTTDPYKIHWSEILFP